MARMISGCGQAGGSPHFLTTPRRITGTVGRFAADESFLVHARRNAPPDKSPWSRAIVCLSSDVGGGAWGASIAFYFFCLSPSTAGEARGVCCARSDPLGPVPAVVALKEPDMGSAQLATRASGPGKTLKAELQGAFTSVAPISLGASNLSRLPRKAGALSTFSIDRSLWYPRRRPWIDICPTTRRNHARDDNVVAA